MQAQTAFCYRCSSEQGENGSDLEVNPNDPGHRMRCRSGTGCRRTPAEEIRCASCSGDLVPGQCAEIKLTTDDGSSVLRAWWVCSARCAYFLGAKHASILIEADDRRSPALSLATSNPRRGGRS